MSEAIYGAASTARQAKIVARVKITGALINLLAQLALARYLNITDYAVFTLFVAASSLLVLFSMFGIDRVCYRVLPPLRLENRWRESAIFFLGSMAGRGLFITAAAVVFHFSPNTLLPASLVSQLSDVAIALLAFVLAMSTTDSLSVFCNGLGRQAAQSTALFVSNLVRSTVIVFILTSTGSNLLQSVLWMFVYAELGFVVALSAVLISDLLQQRTRQASASKIALGFKLGAVLMEGATTQLSYVLRIPFGGPFLRLLVGSFAPPLVTAAYGFFQTLADRIYQFLPPIMLKGVLEPALTADFAKNHDLERVAGVISVLLKLSLLVVAVMLTGALGVGEDLVNLMTANKYGAEIDIAFFVFIQLAAQVIGEVLWITLNPIGRVIALNRVWYGASVVAGIGLGAAYWLQSIWMILLIAPLPYFATYFWIRLALKEKILMRGIGFEAIGTLMFPSLIAACGAQLILRALPAGYGSLPTAMLVMALLFGGLLMRSRLFTVEEHALVSNLSPKLANALQPFFKRK